MYRLLMHLLQAADKNEELFVVLYPKVGFVNTEFMNVKRMTQIHRETDGRK